jgi:hypothetical protein
VIEQSGATRSLLDGEGGNGKRLSFHLCHVDRLIQLPTLKGGLNMRKELEAWDEIAETEWLGVTSGRTAGSGSPK